MEDSDLSELHRLSERIGRLEDIENIRALRRRFHHYVNENQWSRLVTLFTPDAHLDYAHLGQRSGKQNIGDFFESMPQLLEGDPQATTAVVKQFIHAHDVELSRNGAIGMSYLEGKATYRAQSFVIAGRFTDRYSFQAGVWLFAEVKLDVFWMVPAHQGWAQGDPVQLTT